MKSIVDENGVPFKELEKQLFMDLLDWQIVEYNLKILVKYRGKKA